MCDDGHFEKLKVRIATDNEYGYKYKLKKFKLFLNLY